MADIDTKNEPVKDTIYIDVDDEITSVIDKVKVSKNEIVALVLPKRAAVMQSIVNMKLLKRMAQKAKKRTVLVTSDPSIVALAGTVGLHVAKNLQSKPAIPPLPSPNELTEEISPSEIASSMDTEPPIATEKPAEAEEETIDVDNSQEDGDDKEASAAVAAGIAAGAIKAAKTDKKDKKIKIPNFDIFRKRMLLIIMALLLLFGLWFWAFVIAPKATVILKTEGKDVASNIDFTADAGVQEFDQANRILPATAGQLKKEEIEKVPATGQKDVGNKASGTVRLYNCNKEDKLSDTTRTVKAGTGISSGNFTFILASDVSVEPSSFSGDTCQKNKPSDSVNVTAQSGGEQYNLSARSYSVAGWPSISADGSAMTGGTTQIVKVVSGADLDSAKQKLSAKTSNALEELKKTLEDSKLLALTDTLSNKPPEYKTTPNVGDEASELIVTSTTNYTMLGIKADDLKKLIEEEVKKQVDINQQPIIDDGLGKAQYKVIDKKSDTQVRMSVQVTARAGFKVDEEELKKEIKGKRRGDIQKLVQNRPGVQDVEVKYRPFWVTTTPKSTKKITIVIEQVPISTENSNTSNNP